MKMGPQPRCGPHCADSIVIIVCLFLFACYEIPVRGKHNVALHWLVKLLLLFQQPIFIFCGREPNHHRVFVISYPVW